MSSWFKNPREQTGFSELVLQPLLDRSGDVLKLNGRPYRYIMIDLHLASEIKTGRCDSSVPTPMSWSSLNVGSPFDQFQWVRNSLEYQRELARYRAQRERQAQDLSERLTMAAQIPAGVGSIRDTTPCLSLPSHIRHPHRQGVSGFLGHVGPIHPELECSFEQPRTGSRL